MLSMSYEEKSSWVSTLAVLAVSCWYFTTLWPHVVAEDALPAAALIGPTAVATVVLVVLQVGGHVLAALLGRPQEADERDRLIALRATRLSDFVMGACVFMVIAHLLTSEMGLMPLPSSPAGIAMLLMFSLVASELVDGVARIVGYRRGA